MAKNFKEKKRKGTSIQWDGKNIDDVKKFLGEGVTANNNGNHLVVSTKFNVIAMNEGDYLLKEGEELSSLTEKDYNKKFKEEEAE